MASQWKRKSKDNKKIKKNVTEEGGKKKVGPSLWSPPRSEFVNTKVSTSSALYPFCMNGSGPFPFKEAFTI
jgi:hypothetical protein